ncbi:MAG: hypothetical protein RIA64_02350, partial [Rhodospirillales bacterium]
LKRVDRDTQKNEQVVATSIKRQLLNPYPYSAKRRPRIPSLKYNVKQPCGKAAKLVQGPKPPPRKQRLRAPAQHRRPPWWRRGYTQAVAPCQTPFVIFLKRAGMPGKPRLEALTKGKKSKHLIESPDQIISALGNNPPNSPQNHFT